MAIGTQAPRKGEGPNLRKHNSQKEAEGLETSTKVWELKKAGLSFRQIANQLDMSTSGVHEAYKRVIKRMESELAEQAGDWLHLHIARLEEVVAFEFRVMKGMDVRPPELKKQHEEAGIKSPPITSIPTTEERLAAAKEVVKTGESLRKLIGIDAPEKSEVDVRGVVGTVDLTELGGADLLEEALALGEDLRTVAPKKVQSIVEASGGGEPAEPDSIEEPTEVQPQEA